MKYFVNTNIIIDLFLGSVPFVESTIRIFESVKNQQWIIYTSDNAITTSYYYLEKRKGPKESKRIIAKFFRDVQIIPVTKEMLITATHSNFKDFEDAVQFHCAASVIGIDGIITRNLKDFKESTIPVYTPEQVL
jgi:predicted nucleic acid-binding protein